MGRSVTPKYFARVDGRDSLWNVKTHGAPTDANAEKYAMRLASSMNPGGANSHLRDADGNIPYPRIVVIRRNTAGSQPIVAEWRAGMFQVYPSGAA